MDSGLDAERGEHRLRVSEAATKGMEIHTESLEEISRGFMGLCLYVLQSRLNTQPECARCSAALSLPPISATMDGDHLGHRSSRHGMEAHTDRYTPTGRKHALDDFVYRILVRRTSAPNVIFANHMVPVFARRRQIWMNLDGTCSPKYRVAPKLKY